jgi:hypothetical protein
MLACASRNSASDLYTQAGNSRRHAGHVRLEVRVAGVRERAGGECQRERAGGECQRPGGDPRAAAPVHLRVHAQQAGDGEDGQQRDQDQRRLAQVPVTGRGQQASALGAVGHGGYEGVALRAKHTYGRTRLSARRELREGLGATEPRLLALP